MALDIDRITNLTEQVSQGSKLLAQGNEKDRATLAMAAWKLVQALEKPQETFYRLWLLDVRNNRQLLSNKAEFLSDYNTSCCPSRLGSEADKTPP